MADLTLPRLPSTLSSNASELQRLLAELHRPQGPGQEAKRPRLGDGGGGGGAAGVLGLLDAAAAQSLPQLAALAAPLGLSLPFLPLNTRQPQQPAPQQPAPPAGLSAAAMLAAMQQAQAAAPPPPPPQLLPAVLGSGSGGSHSAEGHSHDSDDGSGEGPGGRSAGAHSQARHGRRRTSEERLNANKEKNRRAQQRFRQRQKERLANLEAELLRLQALCRAHNIDPSPAAPLPALPQTAAAAPLAPAPAGAAAVPTPPLETAAPSTQQMYEEVERILELCQLPPTAAIAYLTAFQKADPETRRCQHSSLCKRFAAGRTSEVQTCIQLWLGAGVPTQPPAPPPQHPPADAGPAPQLCAAQAAP